MEINVNCPGGLVMEARFGDFAVATDQPVADGGTNTAPSPFDLFMASLANCAGYYVMAFCKERNLNTDGISLKMTSDWNEQSHLVENVDLTIALPDDFPAKYQRAVVRAANLCTVKRHLENPPNFRITAHNGHPD